MEMLWLRLRSRVQRSMARMPSLPRKAGLRNAQGCQRIKQKTPLLSGVFIIINTCSKPRYSDEKRFDKVVRQIVRFLWFDDFHGIRRNLNIAYYASFADAVAEHLATNRIRIGIGINGETLPFGSALEDDELIVL